MKQRKLFAIIAAVLALCTLLGVVGIFVFKRENELDRVQQAALSELDERRGEYDEKSIVLYGTTPSAARSLAQKLDADLRLSSDGKFASLKLRGDVTIRDVFRDRANREDIPQMSPDYQVKVSDLHLIPHASETPVIERPQYTVTDADYNRQTYLDYLNLDKVWNTTKGSGITVAVIDTGIDTDHPEFAGRISEYSYNATEDKIVKDYTLADGSYDWSLVEDEQGHGTAVTGVIAASMNSGNVVGIAPSVTIIAIKAECNEKGVFKRTSDLVFGLYYAIERDVNVVNMSFGAYMDENPFAAATQLAHDSDIICVAAAGNEETASLCYPAADPLVFGVGAVEGESWWLADYSNYGENVDLVAPGTTYTTLMGGKYGNKNGTSLAAPCVTGAVALYLAKNRYSEFSDVREALYASCYDLGDLGHDWYFGFGALDISALVLEERGTVTFDMMTDELENTEQIFIRNHTLQDIPEPERLYAVFDGWYYDPQCTEPYNLYEDKFVGDLTLYAGWVNEDDGVPYTYVTLEDGTVEIRSYTGHRRYITIPDTIDGKIVSSIGVGAFKNETRLREVILPSALRQIRDSAFEGCSSLVHIHIPETVTAIGAQAFYNNVRLSYVALEGKSSLASVGGFAFAGCAKLQRFDLPVTLTSLDGSAFYGATSLVEFHAAPGNKAFKTKNGVLFNHTSSVLVCYPAGLRGAYEIPNNIRTVGVYAFAYTRLEQIDLSHVSEIRAYAFAHSSLESITIPDRLTAMEAYAFVNSFDLSTVTIGKGITKISPFAFAGCHSLSEIEIPANIESIEEAAFKLTGLTRVTFAADSKLAAIGKEAFKDAGLCEIKLPASVIAVGASAFANNVLSAVTFEEGSALRMIGAQAFINNSFLTSIALPARLEQIGAFAFAATGLKTVTVPASVAFLGEGVFGACKSLTAITVESGNTVYKDVDGVVYDTAKTVLVAYPAGSTRTSYTVPAGVTAIGEDAFYGTELLNYVYLPATLTEIRREAFIYCTALRSLSIPDAVVQISNRAFFGDWNLTSVSFGANSKLPRISYEAFAYCGLTSFRVPASVSTMAQGAFAGCVNLRSFTFAANSKLESISAYMFDGCSSLTTITFEAGSRLTSIQAHGLEGLRKLTTINFGDAKLTNIDNFAFRFCESLKRFDVPAGVTYLGRYAFYECDALAEVTIPESVEYIGRFAFLGADSINVYFAAETLPAYVQEDWDHGINGYYLGVSDVTTEGDWTYATLTSGGIAIIQYTGTATAIDLSALDFGGDIVNIGGKAFAYSTVESITLPETLVTIQPEAFYHSNLRAVTIPASVQFIGRSAFGDTPIASLTFADGSSVRVIEQSAFEGTKSLGAVTLPASLETMGRAVFKNSGVTSLAFEEGIAITEISEEAFAYTNISALILPNTVTVVGDGAFRGTKSLESVAFGNADEIMLRSNAFYASGLKTLHVPANVTYIGEYALIALENLTAFTVDEANPNYKTVDGLLVSKDGRKLIAVPAGREGVLTVPEGIEVIGFGAFEESKLTQIKFLSDANILSFGYRAFYGSDIIEMHVPASVVAIDYYAFANCESLVKVTFAEGNELRGVYEGAFYGCLNLCDITLPDTVAEISDYAFYGCKKIEKLPISDTSEIKGIYDYAFAYTGLSGKLTTPETLFDIGAHAFMGNALTSVTVPDTKQKELIIGIGAFEGCNSMEEITLPFIGASFGDPDYTWFGYIFGAGAYEANSTYVPESLKRVTITEGIQEIGEGTFYKLDMLEEMSIPHSVTVIHKSAFSNVVARYELTNTILTVYGYSAGKPWYYLSSGHLGVGLSGHLTLSEDITDVSVSFSGFKNLTGVTLPAGINYSWLSFQNCTSLKSITIPKGVTSFSFRNCTSLTSITLPSDLKAIGTEAFRGCTNLTEIVIPDSVESIGQYAFYMCGLKKVTIGSGVTTIWAYAFQSCPLETVIMGENVEKIYTYGFVSNKNTDVYIKDFEKWCNIDFYDGNGTNPLQNGGNLYLNGELVTDLVITDTVTEIGRAAFYGCASITSVTIPEGITSIGDEAFQSCKNLKTVTLPSTLTSIGTNAFKDCSNLLAIYNNSELPLTIGSSEYGSVAYYARSITDKNGNKTYKLEETEGEYVETPDGFRFKKDGDSYQLVRYGGIESTVTLPESFNGNSYTIYRLKDVENVIIPRTITKIDNEAFYKCTTLKSITLHNEITSIGNSAFYGCSALQGIKIPESVTSIGDAVFLSCVALTDVKIPDSVENIGSSTFYGCSKLVSVTLPKNITTIGSEMFRGCNSLECLSIPDSVTSIGGAAFSSCKSLKNIKIPKNVTSIGSDAFEFCSELTSIEIPAGVTELKMELFRGCTNLAEIILHEGLTKIGQWVFYDCESLVNLTLPVSVNSIDTEAFYKARHINWNFAGENENFVLENGVLYNKAKTKLIYVANYVTEVCLPNTLYNSAFDALSAFQEHPNIQRITFEEGSRMYEISNEAFSNCVNLKSVVLPDSVTTIRAQAFYKCTSLTEIVMPPSLRTIQSNAFYNCRSLTEITIPQSVTIIGAGAFSGCANLSKVYIADLKAWSNIQFDSSASNPLYNESAKLYVNDVLVELSMLPNGITYIPDYLFSGRSDITSITIPNDIMSIGEGAFKNCTGLTSILIPDSVTNIGGYAFSGCTSLTSIVIPEGVTALNQYAFENCTALASVKLPDSLESLESFAFYNCKSLTDVVLPEGLLKFGQSVFQKCTSLVTIVIPDSVVDFRGFYVFDNCTALKNVTIGAGISVLNNSTFGSSGLEQIVIPGTVDTIDTWAFYLCSNLKRVIILDGVTEIDYQAFNGCNLDYIVIPDSVTTIHQSAFYKTSVAKIYYSGTSEEWNAFSNVQNLDKTIFYFYSENEPNEIGHFWHYENGIPTIWNLANLEFTSNGDGTCELTKANAVGDIVISSVSPDGDLITSIGEDAFNSNRYLTSVTIPDSVTSIGRAAFSGCTGLVNITIPDSVMSIGQYAFRNCSSLTSITIPDSMTSIGQRAFSGFTGLTTIVIPDSVTSIGYEAFSGCSSLTSVTIPDSVTSIGKSAFYDCDSITSITIPNSVTSISEHAFHNCSSLTSVTLPDSVTSIGYSAFSNCSSLTNITIPDSVTSIGQYAFRVCSSLTSITIPDSVTSIGGWAFEGCSSLTSVTIGNGVTSISTSAFSDTAYYNDPANWENGALYIGNYLIRVSNEVVFFEVRPDTKTIVSDAFEDCYLLKKVTIGGNHSRLLSDLTNLETLVITEMPTEPISYYFSTAQNPSLPITLKNIVLTEGVKMNAKAFCNSKGEPVFSGITIYVSDTEKDVRWDENYPNWHQGNKVVYGDRWITAKFYDASGALISSEIFLTSQVIRQPYIALPDAEEGFAYVLSGWDLDGDGKPDTVPATSTTDIVARPLIEKVLKTYRVTFYDTDGKTVLYTLEVPHGSTVTPPTLAEKEGYTFNGWTGLVDGMTASGDVSFTLDRTHNGGGHVYNAPVWVAPTCTEKGYNKHTCSICGEFYVTDAVDPLGHDYTVTVNAPACETDGHEHYDCKNCTESYTVILPATGHDYTERIIKESTCERHGTIRYTCNDCGNVVDEQLPLKAHDYQKKYASKWWLQILIEKILNIFFGYEGDEAYYYVCVNCDHIRTEEEVAVSGTASVKDVCSHTLGDWITVHAASCNEGGIEGRVCSKCGEVVEARLAGDALGHTWGDWIETKAPTTEEEGEARRDCTACDHFETRPIEVLPSYKLGDVNADGKISNMDVLLIFRYIYDADLYPIEPEEAADVNHDGKISNMDVLLIFRYIYDSELYPIK